MELRRPILYAKNRNPTSIYRNGYLLGISVDFSTDKSILVDAKLQVLIEHVGTPTSTGFIDYGVGVNVGLCLRGPASSVEALPPYTTLGPEVPFADRIADIGARRPPWLTRTGHNIMGRSDHYFADSLLWRGVIDPPNPGVMSHYRLEAWGSAGTDGNGLDNCDGLVRLYPNDTNPAETDLNYLQVLIYDLAN